MSFVLTGDIVTLDPARPRVAAIRVEGGTIAATGALESVGRAGLPLVRARGVVVPGFIDSHFYLQRAGVKIVDLFPDREPDVAEFQAAMARTALEPDWNRAQPPTTEDRREGLRRVQPLLHALGITGIADPWATRETVRVYQAADSEGELGVRVTAMPYDEGLRDHLTTPDGVLSAWEGLGVGTGFGNDRLSFGAAKVYVDGEGRRGQALRETPWPATGDRGVQAIDEDELVHVALRCAQSGWALGVHAIGGAAMRVALDAFERVNAVLPLDGRRFRLIHAYLEPSPETMARAAALGVLVSSQPAIQWHNGAWLAATVAADTANPLRSWLDAGVRVAVGSDGPYFPFDPLRLMWFTRTRAARGSDAPIGIRERLTPEEALRACTSEAAYAAFVDHRRGMLGPGLLADWAELSVDPLSCTDDELAAAHVERTVVGGRVAYAR
jgi:hypothetical protein